jgi:hypothetical protein
MAFEIELSSEAERVLRAEASRRGISVQDFARGLLEERLPRATSLGISPDEEERCLDELAELGRNLAPIPENETYSRDTIYAEHD